MAAGNPRHGRLKPPEALPDDWRSLLERLQPTSALVLSPSLLTFFQGSAPFKCWCDVLFEMDDSFLLVTPNCDRVIGYCQRLVGKAEGPDQATQRQASRSIRTNGRILVLRPRNFVLLFEDVHRLYPAASLASAISLLPSLLLRDWPAELQRLRVQSPAGTQVKPHQAVDPLLQTVARKIPCPVCRMKVSPTELTRHLNAGHDDAAEPEKKIVPAPPKIQTAQCPMCQEFLPSKQVALHLRDHHNSVACPRCRKPILLADLLRHVQSHRDRDKAKKRYSPRPSGKGRAGRPAYSKLRPRKRGKGFIVQGGLCNGK